jgi:hypothetical protein
VSYQSGENLECHARRSGCRDFKSANSYYLDGKPIQTMHFQELLSAAGNYSIKVFNPNDALLPTEEVTIAPPKNAAGKYYCPMFCEDDKV